VSETVPPTATDQERAAPAPATPEPPAPPEPAAAEPDAAPRRHKRPPLWLAFLHLAAIWALAVVQPIFDLLGKDAAFFIVRDNTVGDILIFAFGLALVPPLLLIGLVALMRLLAGPRIAWALLAVCIGLLLALFSLQLLPAFLPDKAAVLLPVAVVLGAAGGWLYAHREGLRTFFSWLAPAPALFLALFLVFSQVGDILFPGDSNASAVAAATSKTPVVLMIMDELPTTSLMTADKKIDARRYPGFGELARTSTWYRNAVGVADGTYVAVPPILASKRPQKKLPTNRSFPRNVFSMLQSRYNIHAFEPLTKVCDPETCKRLRPRASQSARLGQLWDDMTIVLGHLVLPEDMTEDLAPIDRGWEQFGAEADDSDLEKQGTSEAPQAGATAGPAAAPVMLQGKGDIYVERIIDGLKVLRSIKPSTNGRPGLWMVHFVMPHVPWRFLPSGHQYPVQGPKIPGLRDQDWRGNQYLANQGLQRHHLQLAYGDTLVQEMIGRMKRAGLWDKSLVIVTADHGADFRARASRRPVNKDNFHEQASVPLFVKMPGQKQAKVDDKAAETLDVLPTIAKVTGGGEGWEFDGTPLDEPVNRPTVRMRNGRLADEVVVKFTDYVRRRDAELKRQLRIFPSGREGLYKFGPNPSLVGRRVSSLRVGGGVTGGRAEIEGASQYGRVKPGSGVLPAWVGGHFEGPVRPGLALAVSVNGRIEGVGEAYEEGGERRFSVIVPPGSFRRGANRVEVFAVRGTTLQRLASAG
jgi:Sulfatase